jgi:hypothetical protein
LLELLDEPTRSNHLCSERHGPRPQLAISRDQRDLIRGIRDDVNERVVSAASGMDDRHAVDNARLHSIASFPFEDHHHRGSQPARSQGCTHLLDECSGCSRSVPPPAGRSGAHDVRCIDEKHYCSLIAAVDRGIAASVEIL